MKVIDFYSELAKGLESKLSGCSFKKKANDLFSRYDDQHSINLIYVQKHSSKPLVSLNFGVHYDFLAKVASKDFPIEGDMEFSECEFKYRIAPDPLDSDYWWPMTMQAVEEISQLALKLERKFFAAFTINGDVNRILPSDLNESLPEMFKNITKIRACVILASIHEVLNNKGTAIEFRAGFHFACILTKQ